MLYRSIESKLDAIDQWCDSLIKRDKIFYLSSDIRNSGFKIAPVDANFFPAGFHLLSVEAKEAAAKLISKKYSGKKILVVAEKHTRNTHYTKNILSLSKIIEDAGNEVVVTNLLPNTKESNQISELNLKFVSVRDDVLITDDGFIPDMVILNNDMIEGIPKELSNIKQPCFPRVEIGWFNRSKFDYFELYNNLISELANEFQVDSWIFSIRTEKCDNLSFLDSSGLDVLANKAETLLKEMRIKYAEHEIKMIPHVFVKADNGTYGMSVMSFDDSEKISSMNRANRKKMHATKGKSVVNSVTVQECIPVITKYEGYSAEYLVYYVCDAPIEQLYRYNTRVGSESNLNSNGMNFVQCKNLLSGNEFKMLTISSKLALISAQREIESIL